MKKPVLGLNDIHIVVNTATNLAKCYVVTEPLPRWAIQARTDGSDGPGINYDVNSGDTPPGLYEVTAAERIPAIDPQAASFGAWYLWLAEQEGQESSRGRAGIGWHGGGSGLLNPWAPRQGWQVTHGCLRSQNEDLEEKVVPSIQYTLKRGGRVWLSVVR